MANVIGVGNGKIASRPRVGSGIAIAVHLGPSLHGQQKQRGNQKKKGRFKTPHSTPQFQTAAIVVRPLHEARYKTKSEKTMKAPLNG